MTRCLISALFLFLLSSTTFAGKIEVAQWVPWKFMTDEILLTSIDESISESSFEITAGELRPKAFALNLSVNSRVREISAGSEGITSLQEAGLSLHINKLIIDQFITREFNGNEIQVKINTDCSPIHIEVPKFLISSQFGFLNNGEYWVPKIEQINIDIPLNSWSISPFSCTGIGGIGEEITVQLKNALRKPDAFLGILYPWLSGKINQVMQASWETLKNSTGSNLSITSMARPLDKGMLIYGVLPLATNKTIQLPTLSAEEFSETLPQLILSTKGFEAILEKKFLSLIPENFDLQKVPAFKDLMKSRLAQYFVWSDLRRFPSSASFLLGVDPSQTRLRLIKDNDQWKAILNSNGFIRTPIGGSMIDYIQFGLGVSTPMEITLQNGQLRLTNSAVDLKMAWNYGLLYQLIYRPNNRIATDILKNAMKDFFANQSVVQDLPVIRWREKDLKLQDWKEHNGIITMDWL